MKALLEMRRSAKEKELEAMLSGEHDSCSCFIEVTFSAVLAAIQWISPNLLSLQNFTCFL